MMKHAGLRNGPLFFFLLVACLIFTGLQPSVTHAAPPASKPLAYLVKDVGKDPYFLWKTTPLSTRMKALLGAQEYAAFIRNMDPAGELSNDGGILNTTGNAPHMGGEEEAVLLIDPDKDVIEVIIMHGGKTVKAWAEKNTALPIPAPVSHILEHWPQPALKAALSKLSAAK